MKDKARTDRAAGMIAKRGLSMYASPFEKRVAKAMVIAARAQDEEVWRTSEETGRHFQIETSTGEIKKGFGGKLNGVKAQPKSGGKRASTSSSSGASSAKPASKSKTSTGSLQKAFGELPAGYKNLSSSQKQDFYKKQVENAEKEASTARKNAEQAMESYKKGSYRGKMTGKQALSQAHQAQLDAEVAEKKAKEKREAYNSEYGNENAGTAKKEKSQKSDPSLGELKTTYKDGTKSYEKKDVDYTPEEQKQWMGAMDNYVKSRVSEQLMKQGYKRSDIDINIDRETGTATVKTWKDDPKSPSGITNEYFDVKLRGNRITNVKPDGSKKSYMGSEMEPYLVFRGSEIY